MLLRKGWMSLAAALLVLASLPLAVYGAESAGKQAAATERASPKEQVIYKELGDTYLGLKCYFEPDDGSNYFAASRIDVVNEDGRATQAIAYVCRGSDSYTRNFRKYLSELEALYAGTDTAIAGYLDLWWDNRIRNWIPGDFYGVEQVSLTDPDGHTHQVTVVAVCGSDDFMEPSGKLRKQYLKGYSDYF